MEQLTLDDALTVGVYRIFNHVPHVHFFVKDLEGRIRACNRSFARLMGGGCEADILGETAFDLCAPALAVRYTADDARVFDGEEMIEQYELNVADVEGLGWYLTTKIPLHDDGGAVVGLVGITRAIRDGTEFADEIRPVVEYIHSHYFETINFEDVATSVNMSIRTVQRRFRRFFGISPQQYLIRQRVMVAAEKLLETRRSVADITAEVGFYDQAALTRQFRKYKGMTPLAYRRRYSQGAYSRHLNG